MLDTRKPKPQTPLFNVGAQHFEINVAIPLNRCVDRLEDLDQVSASWLYGSKPSVSCVPMRDNNIKFHVLRRAGLNMEVEAIGTIQQITDTTSAVIGLVRIPQSSFMIMALYIVLLIGGSVFIQFILPVAFNKADFTPKTFIFIWVIIMIVSGVRLILTKNRLYQIVIGKFDMGRY